MHLVEEKIGVTAVDEEDELVLDFCRLAGGAVDELFEVDILLKNRGEQISRSGPKSDRKPRNGFLQTNGRKNNIDV
jgi:hypothetical protein